MAWRWLNFVVERLLGFLKTLRRAAQWCQNNGMPGESLAHRMKAGDTDAVAGLVGVLAFPAYQHGRVATVERWFGWLDDHGAMETHPSLPVLAAMAAAMTGKPAEAERWASIAERREVAVSLPDGSPTTEPWLALLRALLCRDGPDQMRADIAAVAGHKDLHPIFPLLAGARIAETRRKVGSNPQRLGFVTQGACPDSHNFVRYS